MGEGGLFEAVAVSSVFGRSGGNCTDSLLFRGEAHDTADILPT